MKQPLIYSFRFPHHGRQASYHHLLDYLPKSCATVDFSTVPGAFWRRPRLNQVWFRVNELRMLSRLASRKVGCVHYLYPENSLFTGTYWTRGKPLLLTWHQPISYIQESPERIAGAKRAALRSAAAVIFLSSDSRDEHIAKVDVRNPIVIKHGIDTEHFTFNERVPRRGPVKIVTVGSVLRDHSFWAETVALMLRSDIDVHFQIICNKQNVSLYKHALAREYQQVSFLENLSDVQLLSFYAEADIAFLPLIDATANNFLLESMASGVPCVVSDMPATREYAGDTAVYVSNKDVPDAARKLRHLAESFVARRDMALAARRKAENELSWPIIAGQHCELYSKYL
jgi:glycosyltransferase involved in cell wall biosynthesis